MSELDDQPPFFLARKEGRRLELDREPHPDATSYLAFETPEFLVLFPDGSPAAFELLLAPEAPERPPRDREAQLCHAFGTPQGPRDRFQGRCAAGLRNRGDTFIARRAKGESQSRAELAQKAKRSRWLQKIAGFE